MKTYKESICCLCGWVYFSVSRNYAKEEVDRFNKYYYSLSQKEQNEYYGGRPSSISNYENCYRCRNSYKNFRDLEPDERLPIGITMNPIINRDE